MATNLNKKIKRYNGIDYDIIFPETTIPQVQDLVLSLANKIETAQIGVANGVAELGADGKVPSGQLPSYVDDVLEYLSSSSFPATGETGKIYIALDTNLTYRWGGSAYAEISPSLALGETSSTAFRGDHGKVAYEHSASVGNPHSVTYDEVGAEQAFSKNNAFNKNFGSVLGTVCQGNDSRLSDARVASDVYAWAKELLKPEYAVAEIDGLTLALTNKLETSLKGANNGLAELGADGKVPSAQLPAYVDDVLEYISSSAFPATGETGKIYIALDTNITYRWSGSVYVEISSSLALGETSSTAYRGDRGKLAYDHRVVEGNPHNVTLAQLGYVGDLDAQAHIAPTFTEIQAQLDDANRILNIGAPSGDGEAGVVINTINAGSPQIGFTDHGDMSWAIGGDDSGNNFKIHGVAGNTIPTINGLANPLFEITTAGVISSLGVALVKSNDSRLTFDDVPVNGQTAQGISSNWAYDHANASNPHGTGTMSQFYVIDGDGSTVTISNSKYLKFVEGEGIDVNFTDTSTGSSTDPFDITITQKGATASTLGGLTASLSGDTLTLGNT